MSVITTCRAPMRAPAAGHDANWSGPGDGHALAHEIEDEGGVDRVAERIEELAELVLDVVRQRHIVHAGTRL